MKRQWVIALGVGLMLVAFVTASAFAGHKGSMGEGRGMRQRSSQSPMGGMHPAERPLITFMLQHREALKLTEKQVGKLEAIRAEFQKEAEKRSAEIRQKEADLKELLGQEKVDLGRVEETLKQIGALETQHRFERIKAIEQGKALLSDEQRKLLDSLIQKGTAPSRMQGRGGMEEGMHGMMGGMMGHGMMMGEGGMMGEEESGEEAKIPPASPKSLTRLNEVGAVTIEATYVDLSKEGKIGFRVKMDTHSVSLDQYRLEALSVLRDDRGREVKAAGWEAPEGSGHHRSGLLVFPARDPSGEPLLGEGTKYIELVIRDVAGVKERVFRWDLPL